MADFDPNAPIQVDPTVIERAVNAIHNMGESLVALGGKVPGLRNVIGSFSDASENATNFFKIVQDGVSNIDDSVLFTAALSLPFAQSLLNTQHAFDEFAKSGTKSAFQVGTAYQEASDVIKNSIGKIPGDIGRAANYLSNLSVEWAASAQGAREFENSILKGSAASGDLGAILKKTGIDLRGLDDITASFRQRLSDTADTTGMSRDQVDSLASAFLKIPGGFDKIVSVGANRNIDLFTAALQLSNGTMRDTSSTISELYDAQIKFNRSGIGALSVLSDISSTAKTMGLPLNIVENSIKTIAERFADMGDNANSAIKIFQRFAPAMQEAGIAPEQIANTVRSVGEGIRSMDIAQKAFLSSQSGGPGGLAGAYKIENMIRQGNIAEVAKMAEDTLRKQFGGRIVTLEEAGQNQGAAAEFAKQVAFLKSGAFGGMAKTDQDAYKLLDVFKKGTGAEELGKFGTSQDSLRDALKTNDAMTQRNTDAIVVANNQRIALSQERGAITLENQRTINRTGPLGTQLAEIQRRGEGEVARTDVLGGTRTRSSDEVAREVFSRTKSALDIIPEYGKAIYDAAGDAKDKVKAELKRSTDAAKIANESGQAIRENIGKPGQEGTLQRPGFIPPETPRRGITGPIVTTRAEIQATEVTKQPQVTQQNNVPNAINVNIQCPECHKQHLQTIVLDEIHQDHKANSAKPQIGMATRR